jgi:hypothetical protein
LGVFNPNHLKMRERNKSLEFSIKFQYVCSHEQRRMLKFFWPRPDTYWWRKWAVREKKEAGSKYIFVLPAITILSLILRIPTMVAHNE